MNHIQYCFRFKNDGSLLANGIGQYYKILTDNVFHPNVIVLKDLNYLQEYVKDKINNGELEIIIIKYEWSFKKYYQVLE